MAKMKFTPEPPAAPDLELMEDLVRASLAVNPAMRGGLDTVDVMERLRQQAAEQPGEPAEAQAPSASDEERAARRANLELFLKSKQRDVREKLTALEEQRKQLEAEVQATRRRALAELVDFLTLLALDESEWSRLLAAHQELLTALKITTSELLKKIKQRRQSYDR